MEPTNRSHPIVVSLPPSTWSCMVGSRVSSSSARVCVQRTPVCICACVCVCMCVYMCVAVPYSCRAPPASPRTPHLVLRVYARGCSTNRLLAIVRFERPGRWYKFKPASKRSEIPFIFLHVVEFWRVALRSQSVTMTVRTS